jgi:hypothetical protein
MSIDEIMHQIRPLSPVERIAVRTLIDSLETPTPVNTPKTGEQIVEMLNALNAPIELVDAHIEDPVEWVKVQRNKRSQLLSLFS